MAERERTDTGAAAGQSLFATTHWSVVLAAGDGGAPEAAAALEQLCHTYWYPLYTYVRRRGYGHEDAQDFTQGFLAQLLVRNSLARTDRAKGPFRSFLLGGMNYFLANEVARQRAKKRGAGQSFVFLDAQSAEQRYRLEPIEPRDPEKLFERRWALTLLDRVLERLEAELRGSGKTLLFERLRDFLLGDRGSSYEKVASELGMSEGAVKVAVHRMRRRYRELFLEEVAQTVVDPTEADDEMRRVFAAVSR
jgi:RNA polymerase sigma-70 factor (ECF subfamily)